MKISRKDFTSFYSSIGRVELFGDEITHHKTNILKLMSSSPIWGNGDDIMVIGIEDEKSYSTIETYVYLFNKEDY